MEKMLFSFGDLFISQRGKLKLFKIKSNSESCKFVST